MQKWDRNRRLVFCLLVLGAICAGAVVCSCRRLANSKQQTQPRNLTPRNLTPGLSEELTAWARRHPHKHFMVIVDRSGNSEEAMNLAALMTEAFEAGGWNVLQHEVKSADPIHGLYCSYGVGQEQAATELLSVLEQKGLAIEGFKHDDDPALGRGGDPIIVLQVGLNS